MYAVIESGGKQHRVELGSEIQVDRLDVQPGDSITLERVLLVADGDEAAIGRPVVDGAVVSAHVVSQVRGPKIVVFKYKPKARTRVKRGFRAELTTLRITDIAFGGKSAAKDAEQAERAAAKDAEQAERAAAEAAASQAESDRALAAKLAEGQAEVEAKAKSGSRKTSPSKPAEPAEQTVAPEAGSTEAEGLAEMEKTTDAAAPKPETGSAEAEDVAGAEIAADDSEKDG